METFGFVVHTVSLDEFRKFWNIPRFIPDFLLYQLLKAIPPFKLSEIKEFSLNGSKSIKGYLIGCPLLPQQLVKLNPNFAYKRVLQSVKVAEKLNAKIVGLGGYTSIVANKGVDIAKKVKSAVTSGNCLTAWSAVEAILQSLREKDTKSLTLAVIGASGSIGSLCARKLSYSFGKVILTARNKGRLEKLQEEIRKTNYIDVSISLDIQETIKKADAIIVTTSSPEALIDINTLKSGAVICDISIPKNISDDKKREDVKIIQGGLIKLPIDIDFGIKTGLPNGVIFGCIAETILLTLEGNFTNYSLGDNIELSKMDFIGHTAKKYKFEPYLGN